MESSGVARGIAISFNEPFIGGVEKPVQVNCSNYK